MRYSFVRDPEFHSYADWRELLTSDISEDVQLFRGSNSNTGQFGFSAVGYTPAGTGFSNFFTLNNFSMNWELYAFSEL